MSDTMQAAARYEPWDEDTTPFRPELRLEAATYRPGCLFNLAPALWSAAGEAGEYVTSQGGGFAYQNRLLPAGRPLRLYGQNKGEVVWDGDVIIPTLIDMRRRYDTGERFVPGTPPEQRVKLGAVWMSLTPMEMMTQRGAFRLAAGTVVLGGLGLGWLLRKVAEKPEVERVVVVEKCQALLDRFGYRMCGQFGKVSDVICADIYNQLGKHGVGARYLLDIWHLYSGASEDDRLVPWRRKLKRRLWAWGLD